MWMDISKRSVQVQLAKNFWQQTIGYILEDNFDDDCPFVFIGVDDRPDKDRAICFVAVTVSDIDEEMNELESEFIVKQKMGGIAQLWMKRHFPYKDRMRLDTIELHKIADDCVFVRHQQLTLDKTTNEVGEEVWS